MAERTHGFLEAEAHPRLSALGGDPRPSFLFDRAGALLWVNGAGAAYLGVTTADRIAVRGFAPDTVGGARIAALARQLAGAEERTLRIALPKGLLPEPVVCRAARVIVGSERCVLLTVVDGSGRLAAPDAAARHIALLATLPASAPASHPAPAAEPHHDADPYAVALPSGADGDADAAAEAAAAAPADAALPDAATEAVVADAEPEPEAITPHDVSASDAAPFLASPTDQPADDADAFPAADTVLEPHAAPAPVAPRFVPPSHGRMVRFVFELDGGLAFSFLSDDLAAVVGPAAAAVVGETWASAAGRLGIDPLGRVGKALGGRDTFTGLTVDWPVQDADLRVPIDLAGMPMFSRDRSFRGYRGFGIAKCGALFPAPMVVTGDSLIPAEEDLGTDAAPALVDSTEPETVTVLPSMPDPEPAADLGTAWTETGLDDDIAAQTSEPAVTGAEAFAAEAGPATPDTDTAPVDTAPTDTAPYDPAEAPAARPGAGLRSIAAAALEGIVPRPIAPPRASRATELAADMAGAALPEDEPENPDTPEAPEGPGEPAPASPPAAPEIQPPTPEVQPSTPEGPEPEAPSQPDRPATPHPEYPAPGEPAAPTPTPEEAPERVPEEAPAGAPAETPVEIPDEAPAGMPEEAP